MVACTYIGRVEPIEFEPFETDDHPKLFDTDIKQTILGIRDPKGNVVPAREQIFVPAPRVLQFRKGNADRIKVRDLIKHVWSYANYSPSDNYGRKRNPKTGAWNQPIRITNENMVELLEVVFGKAYGMTLNRNSVDQTKWSPVTTLETLFASALLVDESIKLFDSLVGTAFDNLSVEDKLKPALGYCPHVLSYQTMKGANNDIAQKALDGLHLDNRNVDRLQGMILKRIREGKLPEVVQAEPVENQPEEKSNTEYFENAFNSFSVNPIKLKTQPMGVPKQAQSVPVGMSSFFSAAKVELQPKIPAPGMSGMEIRKPVGQKFDLGSLDAVPVIIPQTVDYHPNEPKYGFKKDDMVKISVDKTTGKPVYQIDGTWYFADPHAAQYHEIYHAELRKFGWNHGSGTSKQLDVMGLYQVITEDIQLILPMRTKGDGWNEFTSFMYYVNTEKESTAKRHRNNLYKSSGLLNQE